MNKYAMLHKKIQNYERYRGLLLRSGIVGKYYDKTRVLIVGQNPKYGDYKSDQCKYAYKKLSYNAYKRNWLEKADSIKVLRQPLEYLNEILKLDIKGMGKDYIKNSLDHYAFTNLIKIPSQGEIKKKWIQCSIEIFQEELNLLKPAVLVVLGSETKNIFTKYLKTKNSVFFHHPSRGAWQKPSNRLAKKRNRIKKILLRKALSIN